MGRRRFLTILMISTFITFGTLALVNFSGLFGPSAPQSAGQTADANSGWTLRVDGLVLHPLNLSFDELLAMPKSIVNADLYCVDAPHVSIAQGNWTGVRLGLILASAGVSPEAVKVALYAEDGYSTDLTLATAAREDIIFAYENNGVLLPEKLRLVVPGKWGYKWISRLNHIQLVDYDFKGRYESMGFSDEADIPSNP